MVTLVNVKNLFILVCNKLFYFYRILFEVFVLDKPNTPTTILYTINHFYRKLFNNVWVYFKIKNLSTNNFVLLHKL